MICLVTNTEQEAAELLLKIHVEETIREGILTLFLCEYEGIQFLLLLAGHGKLNTGLGIGYVVSRYEVTMLIGFGDCISIWEETAPLGSVVILTASVQTDVSFIPIGYPQGVVPGMDRGTYAANPILIREAQAACEMLKLPYVLGSIGSSDLFVCNESMAERFGRLFDITFLDNESGAVGQAACALGIPYVAVKGVAAYGNGNAASDYESWSDRADKMAGRAVYQMLGQLLGY